VTEAYSTRTLTLPLFAHMTRDQAEIVVAELEAACSQ
jgi:dTDP-4-amino-4,6-dideoxygalactose transaminase